MSKKHKLKNNSDFKKRIPSLWLVIGIIALVIVGVILIKAVNSSNEIISLQPAVSSITPSATITSASLPLEVSPEQALQMQEEGAFILDVREQNEWDEGHVKGATLIPLGELPNRLTELPNDQQIIVMCRTGKRSAQGRDLLFANGFTQVTSMAGGITAWSAAGLPTITGN
jgi:rhodanese-related sulfurtransferase